MAAVVASAASSLPRQLLRYLSVRLGALYRSAPSASLQQPRRPPAAAADHSYQAAAAAHGDEVAAASTSVPRGVDVAAAGQLLATARRGGAPPKGRPGQPREGSGGKVNALPTSARMAKRGRTPTPPGPPAEGAGGRGGIIHAAPASASSSILSTDNGAIAS